jgi:hypothetical protein
VRSFGPPYRRLERNASLPANSCTCVKVHSRLHSCGFCCRVDMILYQKKAFEAAKENPDRLEFITTKEPPLDAHVIKGHQDSCCKCQERYEECERREAGSNRISSRNDSLHFTEEPAQMLQCIVCAGSGRGYIIFGEAGSGGFSRFGTGPRIKRELS